MKVISTEINGRKIKALVDGNATQGAIYEDSEEIVSPFIRRAVESINSTLKAGSRVLILGGGTYTLPRYIRKDINVEVLEINPEMFTIAVEEFGYKQTSNIFHHFANGKWYRYNGTYDCIVMDIHDGEEVPDHFRNAKFYKRLSKFTNWVIVNEFSNTASSDFDYSLYNVKQDEEIQPKEQGWWHYKELYL